MTMSKFLTPAFVRVQNPAKRQELTDWMKRIGINTSCLLGGSWHFIYVRNGILRTGWCSDGMRGIRSAIDCGTNVALFKELASMTDSLNDGHNWFTDGKEWARYPKVTHSDGRVFKGHKATAEEIINHFNPKQS